MIVKLPFELRELQEPWLKGLDKDLSIAIRLNSTIEMGERGQPYRTDYLTARRGTIIGGIKINEDIYYSLNCLMSREYLKDSLERREESRERLEESLSKKNVSLELKDSDIPSEAFDLVELVYDLLPEHHLGNQHLNRLVLGGWGNYDTMHARYKDSTVHLFSSTVKGARRNFLGLLLHETGHAFYHLLNSLDPKSLDKIRENYEITCNRRIGFGADYLLGANERAMNSLSTFPEFVPEFYLFYVSQGERFQKFLNLLDDELKSVWFEVYDIFKGHFGGIEYR